MSWIIINCNLIGALAGHEKEDYEEVGRTVKYDTYWTPLQKKDSMLCALL
ncbi:MAG: hypothetical protein ACE5IJ_02145 [Thermoplasmata archaeon]